MQCETVSDCFFKVEPIIGANIAHRYLRVSSKDTQTHKSSGGSVIDQEKARRHVKPSAPIMVVVIENNNNTNILTTFLCLVLKFYQFCSIGI